MKKRSLSQKILHLLRKRSKLIGGTTVLQISRSLKMPRPIVAKAIFRLFNKEKLEIYHQYIELKRKKPRE